MSASPSIEARMSATLLSGLNPEQLAAVTLGHGSALVLAGAGSGKTRVLTTRIAYLIQTGAVSPAGLLAVTFTNKAAKEMLLRLTAMMPINTRGMWVGTFHGLCNRLLRAHFREAGLPQLFQILDVQDQLATIKRLLKATNTDEEKYAPRQVQFFISGNKEKGLRPNAVEAHDPFTRKLVELYALYDEQCSREGVVDFAELLLRSYELLTRNTGLLEHYRNRFKFILVDEFQDTNRLQYNWIKLLAGETNCVFAVGDDDQSIYAFRGAEIGNMRDLERDFHIKKIIKLEQNYRSQGNILDSANSLIKNNNLRLGKNLWTAAGEGEKVRVFEAASDMDEAQYIIDEVNALHREGMNFSDMALLYRSNAQSRVLEHALFRAGIGYRVYGGLRFFERQEIKHALAYLRLAANCDDDTAFTRVVNFPTRGIGARSIEQLQEAAKVRGVSLMQTASDSSMGGRAGISLQNFVTVINGLKSSAASLPLPELMEEMLDKSGLRDYYQNEKDGADRLENLNELVTAAAIFQEEYRSEDSEETSTPLASFLAHASLEAGEHEAGAGQDALQLMTVHAAKGLEFHAVFVSGVEEGLFPHENAISEADGIEEERRLMYVAITRARKRLYLSHAQSRMLHGQIRYGIVSRFIDEIPGELTHRIVLRDRAKNFNAAPTFDLDTKPYWNKATQPASVYGASIARNLPFNIGQNVVHAKFGEGVVVNCEGRGNDARVQVKFREAGIKWLALEYANLSAA
ncbi:MAG: UvrD-helicase domain-containing protein [Burkholderiales bacterium]